MVHPAAKFQNNGERNVEVKALKRGNVNTSAGIFHFDPDGVEKARQRSVPLSVAKKAKDKGLVSIVTGQFGSSGKPSGPTVAEAATERRQKSAAREPRGLNGGGDTRDTTAFPKGQVEAGTSDGVDEADFLKEEQDDEIAQGGDAAPLEDDDDFDAAKLDASEGLAEDGAGEGDDTAEGADGDDTAAGGEGDDTAEGADGDDTAAGGEGDDTAAGDQDGEGNAFLEDEAPSGGRNIGKRKNVASGRRKNADD